MFNSLTPSRRISMYYFSQFMAGGAGNAYAGIWLAQQGLSDAQIGMVNSVPIAIILLASVFVGRLADRASDWRQVIVLGTMASAVASVGLFFASGFLAILLCFTLLVVTMSLVVPVADAAGLHLRGEHGLGWYRALCSVGYLVMLFATGFLVMWTGPWIFVPLFVGLSFVRGGAALLLPPFKAAHEKNTLVSHDHKFKDFFQPWLILPLAGWALVYATHLVLNGFQSLLWSEQGFSSGTISALIAVGAASEALAFFLFGRFAHRVNLRGLIAVSGVVTVLRWWAMSYSPALVILVPLQMLHGLTFALGFIACVNYIGKSTDKAVAAEAQSFFTVLQQVFAIGVITVFSWVSGNYGAGAYLANSAMALIGVLIIFSGYFFKPPASTAPDQAASPLSPT